MGNSNIVFENGLAFKLAVEQITFRNWLLQQPKAVILKRSKELVVRNLIVRLLEQDIQKWLLLSHISEPLAFLYSFYELIESETFLSPYEIEQEAYVQAELLLREAAL